MPAAHNHTKQPANGLHALAADARKMDGQLERGYFYLLVSLSAGHSRDMLCQLNFLSNDSHFYEFGFKIQFYMTETLDPETIVILFLAITTWLQNRFGHSRPAVVRETGTHIHTPLHQW